jgi:transporter family-2 protein
MPQLFALIASAALAVAAGVSFILQQAMNVSLRHALGSAAWAGFVSYLGGTLCMLLFVLALRETWPPPGAMARADWWAWTGGFFGAVYIVISIFLVPRLGAAAFIALLIAGQMIASLVLDHFGLFGIPRNPADLTRIAGAALLVAGVVLMRI